jgi:hypothetical protein
MSEGKALARAIAARTQSRFIEIQRERGGGKVPFTEEQLSDMRGGLTVEEYRTYIIRKFGKWCSKRQGMSYRRSDLIGFLFGMVIALLLLTGIAALASLY